MYLQKVIRGKTSNKISFLLASWRSTMKIEGSGSASGAWIRESGSGTITISELNSNVDPGWSLIVNSPSVSCCTQLSKNYNICLYALSPLSSPQLEVGKKRTITISSHSVKIIFRIIYVTHFWENLCFYTIFLTIMSYAVQCTYL